MSDTPTPIDAATTARLKALGQFFNAIRTPASETLTEAAARAQIEREAPDLHEAIAAGDKTLGAAWHELESRAKLKSVNQVHRVKGLVSAARLGDLLVKDFDFTAEALVTLTGWMRKNESITLDDLEAGLR